VSFADLDINHPAGADMLLRRIESAASTVCGGEPSVGPLAQSFAYQRCRTDAIRRAIGHANAPMLTAAARRSLKPTPDASR
jgi:UrcA family protein